MTTFRCKIIGWTKEMTWQLVAKNLPKIYKFLILTKNENTLYFRKIIGKIGIEIEYKCFSLWFIFFFKVNKQIHGK